MNSDFLKKQFPQTLALCALLAVSACAKSGTSIFPATPTITTEDDIILPNPISVFIDSINEQIVVANSNVDIFFNNGSLALLTVDSTDPQNPLLQAEQIITTPNFATNLYFDAANSNFYLPFRETSTTDTTRDQVLRYTLATGSISLDIESTAAANPFGITSDGTDIYVVSDNTLGRFDADLNLITDIDLRAANTAGVTSSNADFAEDIAIDTTNNRAYVANANGRILVVDLNDNSVVGAIAGPQSSRDVLIDGTTLYVSDPTSNAVWFFDTTRFTPPATTPGTIDDSTFVMEVIPVGTAPYGMAADALNNKLYVTNSLDNSLSVIDTLTKTEVARLSLTLANLPSGFDRGGTFPISVAIGNFAGQDLILVTCFSSNAVILIEASTLTVKDVFPNNTL